MGALPGGVTTTTTVAAGGAAAVLGHMSLSAAVEASEERLLIGSNGVETVAQNKVAPLQHGGPRTAIHAETQGGGGDPWRALAPTGPAALETGGRLESGEDVGGSREALQAASIAGGDVGHGSIFRSGEGDPSDHHGKSSTGGSGLASLAAK